MSHGTRDNSRVLCVQTTGLAEAPASHSSLNSAMWHARCAVLSLLGIYLHASPHVQRLAVRKWNIVPVLIGLLWEQPIQKLALDMVRLSLLHDCFYRCN